MVVMMGMGLKVMILMLVEEGRTPHLSSCWEALSFIVGILPEGCPSYLPTCAHVRPFSQGPRPRGPNEAITTLNTTRSESQERTFE